VSVQEITSRPQFFPDLGEAWRHRQLAVVLARRNIKARYMQTLLGSVWIVIQPLLLTGVLTLVFGALLSVPSEGLPYALFAFTGITIWTAFQRTLADTGISLASSGGIILKVYFPRILIPLSAVLTSVVDLLPVYVVLLTTVAINGRFSGLAILLSPFFMLLALIMAFAVGLWVTILDAVFRDVRLVVPSVLQLVFYATPVMYAQSVVPERWLVLYRLNPILGVVTGFRWSMVADATPPSLIDVAWSGGFAILLLVGGLATFARLENFAVDRI